MKYPVIYVDTCHDLAQTHYIRNEFVLAYNRLNEAYNIIPGIYKYSENSKDFCILTEECIEDYWQELGKICALRGDLDFRRISFPEGYHNGELSDKKDIAVIQEKLTEAFKSYIMAAGYFGRFLGRPLVQGNNFYPQDAQIMENHFRFIENIYNRLSSLNEKDIEFLQMKVRNQVIESYSLESRWIDHFFKQPFDLLLRRTPDLSTIQDI
jgi:hypothetical protein